MLTRRRLLAVAPALLAGAPQLLRAADAPAAPKPKFELGLVTYNAAKDWDLPTLLAHCQKGGVKAVECRTTHRHGVEPKLSADERKEVKSRFADAGVVFWGCGSVCEFHSDDPAVVARNVQSCREFLTLTADCGGRGVKVRPNGVARGQTPEQACAQIGKALKECGQFAQGLGLEVWLEVHGDPTQKPALARRIMDECGHPSVGLTWNSNPTDVIDGSLAEAFKLLGPSIKSCHINELDSGYPYADLFARLSAQGYDRYTLIEVKQ